MKTVIMGYSGSGKSTLAQKLQEKDNRPVLHLDSVQYMAGWQIRPLEEQKKTVRSFMDTHAEWIIDGNYSRVYQKERLEAADEIVLLLFGRWNCLRRVLKRYRKYKNQTRPDMAEGCEEKVDAEFVFWILFGGRTREKREAYTKIQEDYREKVTVIRNNRQLDAYYRQKGIEKPK